MDTLSLQPHQRYFNVLEKVNKKIKKKERKEERKIVYFYFMCMCLSVHVYTYPILAWCLWGPEKGICSPGTRVMIVVSCPAGAEHRT